jgi:hypothetical protein
LRVEVTPDQHVGVLETRSENANPHLVPAGRRQASVDHLKPVGIAEALDVNNPVVRLFHGQIPAPIRKIPDDLLDAFTMGGRIPIVYSDRKAFRPASVTLITESRRLTGFSSIKPMRRRC